jgi:hypothetical protein
MAVSTDIVVLQAAYDKLQADVTTLLGLISGAPVLSPDDAAAISGLASAASTLDSQVASAIAAHQSAPA